ncbi:uncharacterized protein SPAPADRAFT_62755 [Spathaspora passalidarum NRRL Y-27907]|uniref:Uncharacterized protein n=1 Tax=Spathaspora passalidarum (strain NRRL Y-27907 / 11-Y1) TaxID=619300 RepID=G3AT91_SPAPN|nr:uncharacterized protein SPAPADRAFT_62755 [Spathaspora passalidarum NRRL Y-27907]EGW30854.1 hypothetical protein SPAPADRAFT_62755 [Spathaspora passalidarum NRRL Y-27907]
MKLPTEFNLSKQQSCASTPMSSPMRKSISIDTVTANPTLKNYRSCSDFVDKLYSVSPKNTYHLNTATALAAASETFDDYMDSDEEVTTEGRHFGGGGGGNFKLKLPGGTEIEFGGGAGGDYRDGDYDHSDDDDGDDNDNRGGDHRDGSHRSGKQRNDPDNDDNTLQNYSSEDTKFDKTTTSAVSGSQQNYTNLISWLFPPLFTIGEKPKFEGQSYPLIKSRLNSYSLNEECVGLESPISPTITSSSIYRYRNFQYFVLYNFDYCIEQPLSSIVIDPVFKKFGELLKTINVWFIILDEWNYWIWQFLTFLTFGIALSLNSSVSCFMVLFIVTCKMFKVNYLHCLERELDFRMVIFGDTIVNLIIIFINIFVGIAYYI